ASVAPPAETTAPAAPAPPTARIVREDDGFYAVIGKTRARLSPEDADRFAGRPARAQAARAGAPPELQAAIESARRFRPRLLEIKNVVNVRAGYKFIGGRITKTPAVVVSVDRKADRVSKDLLIPAVLPDGMPTDVTVADPLEQMEAASLE